MASEPARVGSLLRLALVGGLGVALVGCAVPPVPDRLTLAPAAFGDLPGWADDRQNEALAAFQRSCAQWAKLPGTAALDGHRFAGTVDEWQAVCAAAAAVPADDAAARQFFEQSFQPMAVRNHNRADGLFTGYFEPTLRGSRLRDERFNVPIYARPSDLVGVDLGLFRPDWRGQRLAGRVVDGTLRPYADRAAIDAGVLSGQGLEIVWVDDPVDAFFLHVQGSGRIELADGGVVRLGFAAQNGHPYTPIGRVLVERGALALEAVSMQAIRDWLAANPHAAAAVMRANASYVFFLERDSDGPVGAMSVVLAPQRSLAIDRAFLPLGVPLWLDTSSPVPGGAEPAPFRRLMIAHDTGGAIRGPVRGDVFWGSGPEAGAVAGAMKHSGRYWLLLPKGVSAPPPGADVLAGNRL